MIKDNMNYLKYSGKPVSLKECVSERINLVYFRYIRFWVMSWRLSESKLKIHSLDEIALWFVELKVVTCAFTHSAKTL